MPFTGAAQGPTYHGSAHPAQYYVEVFLPGYNGSAGPLTTIKTVMTTTIRQQEMIFEFSGEAPGQVTFNDDGTFQGVNLVNAFHETMCSGRASLPEVTLQCAPLAASPIAQADLVFTVTEYTSVDPQHYVLDQVLTTGFPRHYVVTHESGDCQAGWRTIVTTDIDITYNPILPP